MTTKTHCAKFMVAVRTQQRGQAATFLLLILGIFLLGGIGLAVDMANMWFHRQNAQNAADAACTAAAMDLVNDGGGATNSGGFTPGTSFLCSQNPTYAPCKYAAFNGYSASGLAANSPSTEVLVDNTISTVPGVPICTGGSTAVPVCYDPTVTANPFVRVTVTDRTQSFFTGLLSGRTTMDVPGMAACGAVLSNAPIPILVLDPTRTDTFNLGGTGNVPKITIYGGPQRSIQVNSANGTAVQANGNPKVDLSQGGPNLNGSDMGVTGGPGSPPFIYLGSPPGQYLDPVSPISDPFAQLPVPSQPAAAPAIGSVTNATDGGCPLGVTCDFYQPGYYSGGISVKGKTAVFAPGLYYLDSDFVGDPNSCLRPSAAVGDGSGGEMFYLNAGTLNIDSNSGAKCAASINLSTAVGSGQLQFGVKCTAKSQVPGNLPASINGNLLMAPCTGSYGDPLGVNDPIGEQHGILFFANRSSNLGASNKTQPAFGGGGTAAALGSLYFHYCNSPNGTGAGGNCPNTAFTDQLTLQGNPGSTSYVVGDIVTDELTLGGTPEIVMDLNPNALYYVLKASLLQ